MRGKASRRTWIAMLAFMGFYLLGLLLLDRQGLQTLPAVLFAGAVGGFISAQRRIQGVKNHGESLVGLIELSALSNPLSTLWAPVSGAIFAVVLHAMFAGELLKGSLFPEIHTPQNIPGVFRQLFSSGCGPPDGVNAAILVVWCFIAGFAERLVPDALSRVVAKTKDHHKEKARGRY